MLVETWMSRPVITVNADDSMQRATTLLKEHHIHILPVMEDSILVGIITDRDLKRASASDATSLEIHELVYLLSKIKVKEIMTRDPITVPPYCTVEETARILLDNKISGAPVVNAEGKVTGIITRDDMLKVMVNLTGVDKQGIQFVFQVVDRPASIHELTDVIRKYGGWMVSILSSYEKAPPGQRNVCIRAYHVDRTTLPQLLLDLKKKATLLRVVDHREDIRDIRYRFA
jgi:acetoin utilization protein AcuB